MIDDRESVRSFTEKKMTIYEQLGKAATILQEESGIRWIRQRLGGSHVDLARLLGVSKRTLIRLELRETNGPSQNQNLHGTLLLLAASLYRHRESGKWATELRHKLQISPFAALHMLTEDNKELWD